MPKLIDYPRTSYSGAWELAEVTDDTGGKCAIETAARKLNRKVSGSFKAIIGSAVKFGLITSKRDLLTTTTLFKRIKHAYDKQEELLFHREAFLHPPLFTQICRKFRARELPVQMLDVMLIREFGVEEINAQGVAKAFVEGCRMVGLLDENNTVADIDSLAGRITPRRELASTTPTANNFRQNEPKHTENHTTLAETPSVKQQNEGNSHGVEDPKVIQSIFSVTSDLVNSPQIREPKRNQVDSPTESDAISNLFGLLKKSEHTQTNEETEEPPFTRPITPKEESSPQISDAVLPAATSTTTVYQLQVSGPGVNTTLSIIEEEDITIAIALLEKIRRQLRA